MMTDTIQVRPDEQFDEAKLAAYLRDKLPGADQPLTIRQFGGGAANLTYLLRYGEGEDAVEYVLRRPPLGPIAKGAHDMGREYRVLSVLYQAYPLAPRAFLYREDADIIGADFFVMERRHGVVVRRTLPDIYDPIPDAPRQMSVALIDALADFHAVDYAALGLESLGRPTGFVDRQIEGWYKRWHAAKVADLPLMDQVYHWLKENRPASSAATLVHNDYKLDNVMLAADDPGRIVAVFDWDMCTLGDPLCDVGALLTYWSEPSDPDYYKQASMMPTDEPRFLSRAELVTRYAERSGRDVSDIRFYHALGLYRLAVIIAQIYIRYHRGQTRDQRFAAFGDMVPRLTRAAYDVAHEAA
jgi:aminoglycoside phosphotransferase (APT) family kinase protein